MCGIAGIFNFNGESPDNADLTAMLALLEHRGPDGSGTWATGPVGFGHRRLSIIDVEGSPQPMASSDGSHHISFNGEILNYRELRGHVRGPLRTGGDTEVLLQLFAERGPDAVELLRGQFAFAVYNSRARELWLVRDRLGILPLYYHVSTRRLVFASEPKAILPLVETSVDESSLHAYLAHRSVPAPRTLFNGVRKVRPGHFLRVRLDGSAVETAYWRVPFVPNPETVRPAAAVDRVAKALEASVLDCLVADVPVGAYLSGGVDSSLIVALMTRLTGTRVETFSAGFGDPRLDEVAHARRVSALLGTRHHEVQVGPEDFVRQWSRLTWHRDAPLSEPADVAVHALAVEARRLVKVVLSGEGSDEIFAGYPKHLYAHTGARISGLPRVLRIAAGRIAEPLLARTVPRARIAARAMTGSRREEMIRGWFAPFTERERDALLGRPDPFSEGRGLPSGDALQQMLWYDCHAWLSDNLLERGDRMSMAASIELRPPFLDYRLVDLAFSLPSRLKIRNRQTKWLVKQVAERHLPHDLVHRRKAGFRVPLDNWFRRDLLAMASDRFLDPASFVGRVIDRAYLEQLLKDHRGGSDEQIRIWTLLSLEVWHETFFKRPAGAANRLAG